MVSIGPEMNFGAGCFTDTDFPYRSIAGHRSCIPVQIFSFPFYCYMQRAAQCIYATYTHTMQTTGYFVGILIKLTTGMQYGHYHFQRTSFSFSVHAGGNTTPSSSTEMELSS